MYKIVTPYNLYIPRKTKEDRKYPINLNSYRNTKPIVNNQLKKLYLEQVREQLDKLPHFDKIWMIYKPFYSRWGKHDKLNVWAVASKYFLDALVETETIDDDNDDIVDAEMFLVWDVAKWEERVEIYIFDNKAEYKEYIKKHL